MAESESDSAGKRLGIKYIFSWKPQARFSEKSSNPITKLLREGRYADEVMESPPP
jgi:hypothetical protein